MTPSISFPPSGSAVMKTLNESNWPIWSLHIMALLHMNGYRSHLIKAKPLGNTEKMWDLEEEIILRVLKMYC